MSNDKFNLHDLNKNTDGTFSKKKTTEQPRERIKFPVLGLDGDANLVRPMDWRVVANKEIIVPKTKKQKSSPVTFWKFQNIQDIFADANTNGYIFIPKNVPSLKNSKQLFKNKKTGKNFVTSSALCKNYTNQTDMFYVGFREKFLQLIKGKEKPYKIKFQFIRDSQRRFDFINVVQAPLDLMIINKWIEDDCATEVVPVFDENVGYDKKLSGVIITVL